MATGRVQSTAIDELLSVLEIPTTFTSYPCEWNKYRMLLINVRYYSNITASIIVSTQYFSTTGAGSRPILSDPTSSLKWEIYKNGNNAVYIKSSQVESTRGIAIYGL